MSAVKDAPSPSVDSLKLRPSAASRPGLPAPPRRTAAILTVALLGSIGVTLWLGGGETSSSIGHLQAHVTPLTADREVRLVEILVEEGTPVEPGETVARLRDEKRSSELQRQRKRVKQLKANLAQLRAKAEVDLAWRMQEIEADLLQAQLQSASFLKRRFDRRVESHAWADLASGRLPDWSPVSPEDLFRPAGFVESPSEATQINALLRQQSARNAAEVAAVRTRLCEARIRKLKRLKRELPDKVHRSLGLPQAESELAAAQNALSRLESQPEQIPLKATGHGTVGVFRTTVGERIAPGETIVQLLDQDRRFVAVRIPSRRIANFRPGEEVGLRFPGGEKRTGRIEEIPPQTLGTVGAPDGNEEGEASVLVRVVPAGKVWPSMPIGTAVDVTLEE